MSVQINEGRITQLMMAAVLRELANKIELGSSSISTVSTEVLMDAANKPIGVSTTITAMNKEQP